jgi:hypothetical protein
MKITIATSIKYGNYKYLQSSANKITHMIYKHWKDLTADFDFRKDVELVIRPVKGSTVGRAFDEENKIEIDPRRSERSILETIAHELTHNEQFKQKRLFWNKDAGKNVWNGSAYSRPSTHRGYLNLPWEIEARDRAAKFINRVWPV